MTSFIIKTKDTVSKSFFDDNTIILPNTIFT